MASVQTSSYGGRYLKLTVTQKKGTSEQNYSTINWTLESIGGSVNYYTIYNYGVWIDGTQRYDGSGLKTKDWTSEEFPAAKGSTSGSFIKYHNADGSVGNISFSLYGSVFTSATNEYTETLQMESIPRYAKVSTYTSDLTETSVKVSWSSDANIDKVQYRLTVDGSTGEWTDVETGINKSSINNNCLNKIRSSHGYYWSYEKKFNYVPKDISGTAIACYSDDGTFIRSYKSLTSASKELNVSITCLSRAISGRRKHCAKLRWRYFYGNTSNISSL